MLGAIKTHLGQWRRLVFSGLKGDFGVDQHDNLPLPFGDLEIFAFASISLQELSEPPEKSNGFWLKHRRQKRVSYQHNKKHTWQPFISEKDWIIDTQKKTEWIKSQSKPTNLVFPLVPVIFINLFSGRFGAMAHGQEDGLKHPS